MNIKSTTFKKILHVVLLLCFSSFLAASPYSAAKRGDLDAMRQYRFEGIDLFVPDERGFIPYEMAALYADPSNADGLRKRVEIMLWLKEYRPEKHKYGRASIALVQSGLKDLGYDVGKADGMIGSKTTSAIKSYQKSKGLAVTGALGPYWLGTFHRELLKDIQFKLTQLGYHTHGTDGIIGKHTQDALVKFRHDKHLVNPDYKDVDALIVRKIDEAFDAQRIAKEKAISKKKLKSNQIKVTYLQAGLRLSGYKAGQIDGQIGSKTNNAVKAFQRKHKLTANGKIDKKTKKLLVTAFTRSAQTKLNRLGYSVGKPDGVVGSKTKKAVSSYKKANKLTVNSNIDSELLVSLVKAKPKKKTTKKQPKKTVKSSSTKQAKASKTLHKVGSNSAKGRMTFNRSGGRVVGCSISKHKIAIEWCEPFYPLPKNNHCEATFKPNGAVINLWCK